MTIRGRRTRSRTAGYGGMVQFFGIDPILEPDSDTLTENGFVAALPSV